MAYDPTDELLPAYNRLNEPSFAELARARSGGGFAHLGNVIGSTLAGGGARDIRGAQVFNQAATGTARLQDILLQARQRRDMEIGRQAAAQEYFNKGDTASGNAILNATNSAEAGQALLHLQRLNSINAIPTALGNLGYTPQMGAAGGALVGASGGTNTEGDIKALMTAGIPYSGTPAVGLSQTQLGSAIVPNATRMGPQGQLYNEVNPSSQQVTGTPVTAAYLASEKALQAERYAQAARATKGAQTDKLQLSTNPDTNEVTVVDLTKHTSSPVTTDLGGDMAGPPAALKAVPKNVPASRFSTKELTDLTGSTDSSGKIMPDQKTLQRFYDTKAAMKAAGDSNWNNEPMVLAKMRDEDQQNAAYAASSGPPSDLAPPEQHWYSGNVVTPTAVDAQGRGLSDLGAVMDKTGGASPAPAATAAPAAAGVPSTTVATPKTKDEFDALPIGSLYINPSDGKTLRKTAHVGS